MTRPAGDGGTDGGKDGPDHAERMRRLRRMRAIAQLMDTAIRIPGTEIRFGADSVLGLVPGIGDAGAALISLFIVKEARDLGVPSHQLVRMIGNIGLDMLAGSVPLIGDVFDVYFKSNRRNVQLVLDHFEVTAADLSTRPGKGGNGPP